MARYDSLRKLERNKALREYKDAHPEASWEEVGKVFGVKRQRAQQLYKQEVARKL